MLEVELFFEFVEFGSAFGENFRSADLIVLLSVFG